MKSATTFSLGLLTTLNLGSSQTSSTSQTAVSFGEANAARGLVTIADDAFVHVTTPAGAANIRAQGIKSINFWLCDEVEVH